MRSLSDERLPVCLPGSIKPLPGNLPGPGVDLAMVDPADRLWPSFLTVSD